MQYSSQAGGYACAWSAEKKCSELGFSVKYNFTAFLSGTGTCSKLLGNDAILQVAIKGKGCTALTSEKDCNLGYKNTFSCYWNMNTKLCNVISTSMSAPRWTSFFASC
jgi:hypothetical protein